MNRATRLGRDFFTRDVLEVAPGLLSKILIVRTGENSILRFRITETEAYRGEEDLACHASKGRTGRTEVMYHEGGCLYVYFVYGMYWMLNVVASGEGDPQAVLIRGIENCNGPGRVTRALLIDRSFYGEDLAISQRIWIEDDGLDVQYTTGPRVGINYAGEYWKSRPWRYLISPKPLSGSKR